MATWIKQLKNCESEANPKKQPDDETSRLVLVATSRTPLPYLIQAAATAICSAPSTQPSASTPNCLNPSDWTLKRPTYTLLLWIHNAYNLLLLIQTVSVLLPKTLWKNPKKPYYWPHLVVLNLLCLQAFDWTLKSLHSFWIVCPHYFSGTLWRIPFTCIHHSSELLCRRAQNKSTSVWHRLGYISWLDLIP